MKKTKLLTSLAALALVLSLGACNTENVEEPGDGHVSETDEAQTLTNYLVEFDFGQEIPSYAAGYIIGSWDSWGEFLPLTLTDNATYTYTFASIEEGSYTYKGVMFYADDEPDWEATNAEFLTNDGKDATLVVSAADDGYQLVKHDLETSLDCIHDWTDWVFDSSCEEGGTRTRTCKICGDVQTEDVEPGHTYDEDSYFYDETGHWQVCLNCGQTSEVNDHEFTYTASDREYYHVGTCECGYSFEDIHELQSSSATTCVCGQELGHTDFSFTYSENYNGYLISGFATSRDTTEGIDTLYLPKEHTGNEGTYPVVGTTDGNSQKKLLVDLYPVKTIVFPNSFVHIGEWSFATISSLTGAVFGDNSELNYIGAGAFDETALTGIDIPDGVAIGQGAFSLLRIGSTYFWIVVGPNGSFGANMFDEIYVNIFYRGTEDQWGTDFTYAHSVSSKTFNYELGYNIYYSNQWSYVNGVPTLN